MDLDQGTYLNVPEGVDKFVHSSCTARAVQHNAVRLPGTNSISAE